MRKPTWIPGLKWVWKTSDRIDIWCQEKFKLNPKQRALELKMDAHTPARINNSLDAALGIRETTKHYPKKKRQLKE